MRHHRHPRKQHSTTALIEPLEQRQLFSAAALSAISDIVRNPGPGPVIPPPVSIAAPNTAGQLDPSFGSGGTTTVDFHGLFVDASAVTTIGNQTLIAGQEGTGGHSTNGVVVRLNFDGSLDTTFGANHTGIATFHVGSFTEFSAIAPGPNNTIYAAGSDNEDDGGNFLVVRLLSNGTLDPTFGNGGEKVVQFGFGSEQSNATAIAIQNDGKIVLAGTQVPDSSAFGLSTIDFAMARLNPNGSQDSSFNGDGTKTIDFPDDAYASAVAIDYSGTPKTNPHYGSIVVAGAVEDDDDNFIGVGAIRVTPSGHLDQTFNGNAEVFLRPPNFSGALASGVAVQSNGDILLSGDLGTYSEASVINSSFGVVRLTPSGQVDKSFGGAGTGWTEVGFGGENADADSILLRPDDSIILGGSSGNSTAIASLTPNGLLDTTFGTGGKVTTAFSRGSGAAYGLAFMGDRIVAAGGGVFATARYIDTNPSVAVGAFKYNATPQSPVTFIVSRSQTLPYPTDVDFSIGGTATAPTDFFAVHDHTDDYTLSNFRIQLLGLAGQPFAPPSVEIPAGQSYVLVTLTPTGNVPFAGTRTATFNITPSTFYNVGTPNNLTINILGNQTTPTTIGASADAYVQDGSSANTNFGSSPSLVVKTGTTGFNRFTYLTFNLSNVSTINSVQLQLFGNLSNASNASVVTDVFSVANTSWTQSGITFNNAPPAGSTPLASTTITGTTGAEYTFNVTSYVQAQVAAGNDIISFALKDPMSSDSAVVFNSSNAGMGPSLLIS